MTLWQWSLGIASRCGVAARATWSVTLGHQAIATMQTRLHLLWIETFIQARHW
jgi:hypothetical protein